MRNSISIIIVEYFCLPDVDSCISLYMTKYTDLDLEFIISSNSQYDLEQQSILKKKYVSLNVQWTFNTKNGGFGYAMNCGAKLAHNPILIFTNPDVQIGDGLNNMCSYILLHQNIGIIAPKIVDESGILQDSCRHYLSIGDFVIRHLKRRFRQNVVLLTKGIDYSENQSVDWVIGAFMMISKEVFNMIGGFDEAYFLYCEDADLCARMKKNGYDIIYYPAATVTYQGTRSARSSCKYFKIFMRSLLRFWSKNGWFKHHSEKRH